MVRPRITAATGSERPATRNAEHAAQDVVHCQPLDERLSRDVHERRAGSGAAEQERRRDRVRRHADRGEGDAEQRPAEDERDPEPVAPDEHDRRQRSDQRPDPGRGPEEADAALADVENVEGEHRVEDVHRTEQEQPPGDDRHRRAELAVGDDRPEPGEQLGPDRPELHATRLRRPAFVGRPVRGRADRPTPGGPLRDGQHGRRRAEQGEREYREDGARTADRDEDAGQGRADERPETLGRARGDVRRGELVGVGDDLGQKRRVGRTGQRHARRGDRRRRVHDEGGRLAEKGGRCARHRDALDEVGAHEDPGPGVPVAEHRDGRSEHHRGQELDERDDGRLGRPAATVGVHDDGEPGRPLADREHEERDLEPAQGGTAQHRGENAETVTHRRRMARADGGPRRRCASSAAADRAAVPVPRGCRVGQRPGRASSSQVSPRNRLGCDGGSTVAG